MKELSIEEKAKAYDIAVKKIEMLLGSGSSCSREELEHVFPQLKESEYERVRKEILQELKESEDSIILSPFKRERWIVWLEEQREQKPFEYGMSAWSEEDKENISMLIDLVESKEESMEVKIELSAWLKSLKDRYTWKPTDEQMKALDDVISSRDIKYDILSELWNDLKKVKD